MERRGQYRDIGQVGPSPDYEITIHIIEIGSGHTLCGKRPRPHSDDWLYGPDDNTLSANDLRRLVEQEGLCPRCREMLSTSGLVDPSPTIESTELDGQYTAFAVLSYQGGLLAFVRRFLGRVAALLCRS